jgi:hypothetical protein
MSTAISLIEHLPVTDGVFVALLIIVIMIYIYNQVRHFKTVPKLRPIPGFSRIIHLVDAAKESGRPIHLSLGLGAINTSGVVDSSVGLSVLEYINMHLAVVRRNCDATCGDATLSSTLGITPNCEVYASDGIFSAGHLYYCGPDPLVYANGVIQHLSWQRPAANLFIGITGAECLYIIGSLANSQIQQSGGASTPLSASLLYAATGDALLGEEYYAAGAYLHHPDAVRSLITQDWLRYIILFAVIVGAIVALLGYGR